MRVKYDFDLFSPLGTHLRSFVDNQKIFFPQNGLEAGVYFGEMKNVSSDLTKLDKLVEEYEELVTKQEHLSGTVPYVCSGGKGGSPLSRISLNPPSSAAEKKKEKEEFGGDF